MLKVVSDSDIISFSKMTSNIPCPCYSEPRLGNLSCPTRHPTRRRCCSGLLSRTDSCLARAQLGSVEYHFPPRTWYDFQGMDQRRGCFGRKSVFHILRMWTGGNKQYRLQLQGLQKLQIVFLWKCASIHTLHNAAKVLRNAVCTWGDFEAVSAQLECS